MSFSELRSASAGKTSKIGTQSMNEDHVTPPALGISLGDILYVVFRHKWKIISISLIGIIGALLLPLLMPPPYQSEAKLFIKYVLETKSPTRVGGSESTIKPVDEG